MKLKDINKKIHYNAQIKKVYKIFLEFMNIKISG